MAKKATPHNRGLGIRREGNKFIVSWKIKASNVKWQKVRYRTHDGTSWSDWTTKKVSDKATTYNFTLDNSLSITQVQAQTQIMRTKTSKVTFKASDWDASSEVFVVEVPPDPELTVSNDSANQTTFSWTITTSDNDAAWYYQCLYRTKNSATPDDSADWSDWAVASASSYTYTDTDLNTTRVFEIKAIGPGGESNVQNERHVICTSPVSTWAEDYSVTYTERSSYYEMTYSVNIDGSRYTVDSITPQYYIGTPDSDMSCPSGASWTDGTTYNYSNGQTAYALAATTAALIGDDECLWARVKTTHDSVDSASEAVRVITGELTAPDVSVSMSTPTSSGFTVTVTVNDAGTEVPGAYMQVYLERYSAAGLENYILIGSIANGASSASITSTLDISSETGYAIHIRNVTADGSSMVSDYYNYETTMPTAPTLNSVSATTTSGKVFLDWTNNWSDATGVIIAWTDDPDNWMSNDDPEEYEITEVASNWYIVGLETGTKWYFRVRSVQTDDESVVYSQWSEEVSIDLSAAPAVPVLYLSPEVITEDDMVTAYWSYVSTDGTSQVAGNIVEATYSDGAWSYSEPIASTTSAQHIDIYASDHEWTNGTSVYLALQTRSGSGGTSDYSTPVQLAIAATPTVTVASTSLVTTDTITEYFEGDASTVAFTCSNSMTASPTVTVDGTTATVASYDDDTVTLSTAPEDGAEIAVTYTTSDNNVLDDMPFTATVTTTNAATITVAIERATAYSTVRPDGTKTDGPIGETVYVKTDDAAASYSVSIGVGDLIGRLDDGAFYNLVVTADDVYGQTVSADAITFKVHWAHQAWEPTANFWTDFDALAAFITPVASGDYVEGDTCDIYRLGADKPELIISGGTFGETYVDPYPAFGDYSGYRIVTITETNDYITEDERVAEYDSTDHTGYPQLNPQTVVIDFDENRVELPYNITLGNTWTKDFKRTVYLGGHIAGDHNKAVTRDLSAATVLVRNMHEDLAVQMRELARYAGMCHVRTPEGSSFMADVQVSENRGYDDVKISYTLNIQKVDTIGFDGMTEEDWSERQ